MTSNRRLHLAWVATLAAVLIAAATAGADHFKPGSLRLTPNKTKSASTLSINASFDQKPGAQLQAYNVDIARGFRFDPRAVAGRCTLAQARSSNCPANSRIGGGSGSVSVGGSSSTFALDFFLLPPQRHGDIAGLALAVHQQGSAVGFTLVGRLVRLAHGPYGLELRFANTANELPKGLTVQLNQVHAQIGARRKRHSLLTTPATCRGKGWPFRLVVSYSTGTENYTGPARCSR